MKFLSILNVLLVFILISSCSGNTGDACRDDRDCDTDLFCVRDNNDGVCTVKCNSDRDCPSNAVCIDKEGGICLEECGSDRDCPIELKCKSKERETGGGEFRVCLPD